MKYYAYLSWFIEMLDSCMRNVVKFAILYLKSINRDSMHIERLGPSQRSGSLRRTLDSFLILHSVVSIFLQPADGCWEDTRCQTPREVAFRSVHQIASSHHSPGSSEISHLPRNRVSSCHLSQQSQSFHFSWVNDPLNLCRECKSAWKCWRSKDGTVG